MVFDAKALENSMSGSAKLPAFLRARARYRIGAAVDRAWLLQMVPYVVRDSLHCRCIRSMPQPDAMGSQYPS